MINESMSLLLGGFLVHDTYCFLDSELFQVSSVVLSPKLTHEVSCVLCLALKRSCQLDEYSVTRFHRRPYGNK